MGTGLAEPVSSANSYQVGLATGPSHLQGLRGRGGGIFSCPELSGVFCSELTGVFYPKLTGVFSFELTGVFSSEPTGVFPPSSLELFTLSSLEPCTLSSLESATQTAAVGLKPMTCWLRQHAGLGPTSQNA
eukprot:2199774-Amphidinium_carterae.1